VIIAVRDNGARLFPSSGTRRASEPIVDDTARQDGPRTLHPHHEEIA
jgi:hypothetical protein